MYTLKLEEISKENKNVGGKAAHLGELVKAGLPVPPGFVVTTEAYDKFIQDNNLGEKIKSILEGVDTDNPELIKKISKEIQELILNSGVSEHIFKAIKKAYEELSIGRNIKGLNSTALDLIKAGREVFVAVRSSATAEDLAEASFAGQMRTFLNVRGIQSLVKNIKECWASLYTPRAIFYRKTKNITESISIGVIVQKMINAEKAGVIFTVDPATNDASKLVIEAAWGLGETVVSGSVTPDTYILDKSSGALSDKKISKKEYLRKRDEATGRTIEEKTPSELADKQVLNEHELAKLFELSKKTEDYYNGEPQDIEWCLERNRIFFVQTRPVTTLGKKIEEKPIPSGPILISGLAASPGVAKGKVKIVHGLDELSKIEKGDILVTKMTSPDMVPYMKLASAIVTDEGGLTAHAAIVSREMGMPCIVGTKNATSVLEEGKKITVDATRGNVYAGEAEIAEGGFHPPSTELLPPKLHNQLASTFGEITATQVKVNIAFPETVEKIDINKVDGIGLLRAEHLITENRKHPVYLAKENPEELIKIIMDGVGKIAKAFYPKPVWYRTLDLRTDEFRSLEGGEQEPSEANPMLGWHGIRRSLDQPEFFKCEIEAIKRLHDNGLTNIAIMLPFVCKVEELKKAKYLINSVFFGDSLLLEKEGPLPKKTILQEQLATNKDVGYAEKTLPLPIDLGIMVETPAAAMDIEKFCEEGIDFISIGSNDLTQLALGIDRGNTNIAKLYSELDPGVLALIKRTIQICRKHNVKTSLCGEAGSNPEMAAHLVDFGIDSISVEMDAIEKIRSTVALAERKLLLELVRKREN